MGAWNGKANFEKCLESWKEFCEKTRSTMSTSSMRFPKSFKV